MATYLDILSSAPPEIKMLAGRATGEGPAKEFQMWSCVDTTELASHHPIMGHRREIPAPIGVAVQSQHFLDMHNIGKSRGGCIEIQPTGNELTAKAISAGQKTLAVGENVVPNAVSGCDLKELIPHIAGCVPGTVGAKAREGGGDGSLFGRLIGVRQSS